MKITLALNKPIQTEFLNELKTFFRNRLPFELDFEIINTNHKVEHKYLGTWDKGTWLNNLMFGTKNIQDKFNNELTVFVYDVQSSSAWNTYIRFIPKASVLSFTRSGNFIEIADMGMTQEILFRTISHEMMHALCFKLKYLGAPNDIDEMDLTKDGVYYLKNDDPYAVDGNYAKTFENCKPYWSLLPKKKYKYFSDEEVSKYKLKPELWVLLDKMREECGFPFKINSGLRTQAENDALKESVSDSSHISGLAVDIACTDSSRRLTIIKVGLANGITRFGIGKSFVHLDISSDKPRDVMWHYY